MTRLSRALLHPKTVALIGASGNPKRLTARPQQFLQRHGFKGAIYPVNPGRDEVLGVKAYPSLADIPSPVEHAYVLLDTDAAIDALKDCAAHKVPVVSILADGFADSGVAGVERQNKIEQIARDAGITLIGPNSTGVVHTAGGFACTTNAAFAANELPQGRFAVLSQSGSMTGALLSRGAASGLGFAAYVSTGNEAVAGIGEIGDALVDDPQIEGFALFLETIRRPDAVARFAQRAFAAGKPVVAYLVGRSQAGQALAVSHTGAMVGGTAAMLAFLRANGVIVVEGFEALIETCNALSVRQQLDTRPRHATVITSTGGGGGMVYDLIGLQGVALSPMPPASAAALGEQGIAVNPGPLVDLTLAGTNYDVMKAVFKAVMADPQTGLIVAAIGSSAQFNPELSVRPIIDAVAERGAGDAPVMAVPIPHAPQSVQLWNAGGVPAFRTPESCAQGVAALLAPVKAMQIQAPALSEITSGLISRNKSGVANERNAGVIVESLGIKTPAAVSFGLDDPLPEAIDFEPPWVLKILSRSIAHKSDAGGVKTQLQDRAAVQAAVQQMKQKIAPQDIDGFMLQQQIQGQAEVIVGFTRDPVVGPMISVGMGGVLTEIYQDIAMRPAPVAVDTARIMIDEVRGAAVLHGYRGAPASDVDALAQTVASFSQLALHSKVIEAEINPLIVGLVDQGAVAADALIHLK